MKSFDGMREMTYGNRLGTFSNNKVATGEDTDKTDAQRE
jgi:hypothetical protein